MALDGGTSKRSNSDVSQRPFWSPVTAEEAVANGIWLLDRKVPDWRTRVKPKALRLQHSHQCVLGQLFGDYGLAILELSIVHTAGEYGFIPVSERYDYPQLTPAWRKAFAA
jgi:hypothetical protein